MLQYLGRYTHRVAISNERLVSLEANSVRFRYKDYAHGSRRRVMELAALEFLRRFTLHVLPRGFMRIRHFGLHRQPQQARASRARTRRAQGSRTATRPAESLTAFWQRIAHLDIQRCPQCHLGVLRVLAVLAPQPHRPP